MPDNKPVTLDGMKFDDGGDAHHDDAEEQHSAGVAAAEKEAATADEPQTETFRIYKALLSLPEPATRGQVAAQAWTLYQIKYSRTSAAMYHLARQGRVREIREEGKAVRFAAQLPLEQAKFMFRSPGNHIPKLPLAEGPATLNFQLFELIKRFPGSSLDELRGYVNKLDGQIATRGVGAALSKYLAAGLARFEQVGGLRRWYAVADRFPSVMTSYVQKKPRKAKTAKRVQRAKPVAKAEWVDPPAKGKPNPHAEPVPAPKVEERLPDATTLHASMRDVHNQNALRDMSVDDILAVIPLPKALALHRALAKMLGHG